MKEFPEKTQQEIIGFFFIILKSQQDELSQDIKIQGGYSDPKI